MFQFVVEFPDGTTKLMILFLIKLTFFFAFNRKIMKALSMTVQKVLVNTAIVNLGSQYFHPF